MSLFERNIAALAGAFILTLLPTVSQAQCDQTCSVVERILADRADNFSQFNTGAVVNGLPTPTITVPGFDFCDFNSVGGSDGADIPDFKCMVQDSDSNTPANLHSRFSAACNSIREAVGETHPDWSWFTITRQGEDEIDAGPSEDHYVVRLFYMGDTPALEIMAAPVYWTDPVKLYNPEC
jgi:hypothetical protein